MKADSSIFWEVKSGTTTLHYSNFLSEVEPAYKKGKAVSLWKINKQTGLKTKVKEKKLTFNKEGEVIKEYIY